MGGICSFFFGKPAKIHVHPSDLGQEADILDPKSSLTPRQIAYINLTWDLVRPDMKIHGAKFFILLFETHPPLQSRFKDFAGKRIEELVNSKKLKAHGTIVMSTLDSYISNLDDLNIVSEMLQIAGVNHKNRGVKKADFELLVPVLITYLRNVLGSSWTAEVEDAWSQLLKLVLALVFSAYNSYDDE